MKQYRGDSGQGIYKVSLGDKSNDINLLPALRGSQEECLSYSNFFNRFQDYFTDDHPMIDQQWSNAITNGMVRCYLSRQKVAGFGYQEIVALYPDSILPSKRYYYTEYCGLFSDLRKLMEEKWVPQLMEIYQLSLNDLPLIWDADFFINDVYSQSPNKYMLCEINVSCVSPFPESAVPHIYQNILGEI